MSPDLRTPAVRWPESALLRFTLDIPLETPSNNEIRGMHFQVYKQLRWKWRMEVRVAMGKNFPEAPLQSSFLVITRWAAGSGLDWDNAYGGLKPLLDCLVAPSKRNPDGLGLILDDSPKHMPFPPYVEQKSAPANKGHTRIEIFEICN